MRNINHIVAIYEYFLLTPAQIELIKKFFCTLAQITKSRYSNIFNEKKQYPNSEHILNNDARYSF